MIWTASLIQKAFLWFVTTITAVSMRVAMPGHWYALTISTLKLIMGTGCWNKTLAINFYKNSTETLRIILSSCDFFRIDNNIHNIIVVDSIRRFFLYLKNWFCFLRILQFNSVRTFVKNFKSKSTANVIQIEVQLEPHTKVFILGNR